MPAGIIATTAPFCRSCGWDFIGAPNRDSDSQCDSCGDLITESYGLDGDPVAVVATGGSLDVSFAWTDNPGADTTDFRHQTDGGAWTTIVSDTSPAVIVAAEDEIVNGQVRSVIAGFAGLWGVADSDVAAA